jgi:hypothetical protein
MSIMNEISEVREKNWLEPHFAVSRMLNTFVNFAASLTSLSPVSQLSSLKGVHHSVVKQKAPNNRAPSRFLMLQKSVSFATAKRTERQSAEAQQEQRSGFRSSHRAGARGIYDR